MNLGFAPIVLYPGLPICQLILEQVDGWPSPYPSQFQGQNLLLDIVSILHVQTANMTATPEDNAE